MVRMSLASIMALAALLAVASGAARASGGVNWTIVASYEIPEGASGLAWDGTDLYCGIYGVDGSHIYRIDPDTGDTSLAFIGQQEDAFGLTFDGQYLWTTDHPGSSSSPAIAMKLDWNGNVLEQFDLPDHYMSGIAYDQGDFWVSRYYEDPGHLYKVDGSGTILAEFDGPDDQPWDLAIHGDSIWIADYWGDALYQVDAATGAVIGSHASEGVDPAGIVWDGQYLWYCDNGDNYDVDLLYKVDLQGGGTPAIVVPDSDHAYGTVAIGDTGTWVLSVENSGSANLVIDEVTFSPSDELSCPGLFPITVPAGTGAQLTIRYAPQAFGPLDAVATIHSNDPVHPGVDLSLTGHGVHPEPTIDVASTSHAFGEVRVGAHTRWFIDVANHGEQPLVIHDVTSNDEDFYLDSGLELPITLGTLATTQIGVWFSPAGPCFCSGQVTIASNAANQGEVQVSLAGSAVEHDYAIGAELWSSHFTDDWDNSFKAMAPIDDVSGDGRSDLVACSEDNFIRCFNGNADQSGDVLWSHEIYSGNIYSGKGLDIVDDVDGDGFDEVVVGATGGARLIRMLSGRTGQTIWTYHTNAVGDGGWVYQVDGSRDYTGDGVHDVLACAGDDGDDTGPKRAYCLNGVDGSPVWQRPLGGPVYAVIAVDDFSGDGIPDAVAGTSDAWEIQGRAVGIDGATGLVAWSFLTGGSSVWSLAQIGDISGDGISDVMIGDFSSGQFHGLDAADGSEVFSGGGLGTLIGFQRIEDVNGDGHPDVVPEHFDNDVRVISGKTGDMLWSTPVVDNPTVAASLPDVSGDGVNDLVVGTLFSNNYTYFLDGVDGTILHSGNFGTPVDAITTLPDVVGDGSWELVAGGRDGRITCFSGGLDAVVFDPADINQDGVVGVADLLLVIDQWGSTDAPADVDGDGIVGVNDVLLVVAAWSGP